MQKIVLLSIVLAAVALCGGCLKESSGRQQGAPESAQRIVKLRGYNFDEKGFFAAAQARDMLALNAFLDGGMNPNTQDADGRTVLISAAAHGDLDVVNVLLDRGADPNVKNNQGGTPLMWAAVDGNHEAAQLLLSRGAEAALKDNDGITAVEWAARNKRENVVLLLRGKR